jgi:hypothetical protein
MITENVFVFSQDAINKSVQRTKSAHMDTSRSQNIGSAKKKSRRIYERERGRWRKRDRRQKQ